jgi:endonuclease/exonuclease/phosphatase (EEP) superfamily protein YafD
MIALHLLVSFAAVALSIATAFLAISSVAAKREGSRDTLASFAPFGLCLALVGGLLVWAAFGRSALAVVLLCLNGIGAALNLAKTAPEFVRLRLTLGREPPALRILSCNLYRLNPVGEQAVAAILERDADVVILQEADRRMRIPVAGLDARYPHVAACTHAGLRIYSKSPIFAHQCNCERANTARGRLLTATLSLLDQGTLTLATTHFSHPYRGEEQAQERKALATALKNIDPSRLILAGDFNSTPWSRGMRRQDEMLAPLRRWTIAWFTWPARLVRWDLAWPLPLLPIDHVYAGPQWERVQLRRVRVPGSDHFATEAAFCLARARLS